MSEQLAKNTFLALKPYINIADCGERYVDTHGVRRWNHMITKQMWSLAKSKATHYPNGLKFEYWHIHANKLSARHINSMINSTSVYGYTGGRDGNTLLMIDIDSHNGETDHQDLADEVMHIFDDNLYENRSDRGINSYLKVNYKGYSWQYVNELFKELQTALNKFKIAKGYQCEAAFARCVQYPQLLADGIPWR